MSEILKNSENSILNRASKSKKFVEVEEVFVACSTNLCIDEVILDDC